MCGHTECGQEQYGYWHPGSTAFHRHGVPFQHGYKRTTSTSAINMQSVPRSRRKGIKAPDSPATSRESKNKRNCVILRCARTEELSILAQGSLRFLIRARR